MLGKCAYEMCTATLTCGVYRESVNVDANVHRCNGMTNKISLYVCMHRYVSYIQIVFRQNKLL